MQSQSRPAHALHHLVVGVDGSAASLRALDWAAATVRNVGRLQVVTALSPPPVLVPRSDAGATSASDAVRAALETVVDRCADAGDAAATVDVVDQGASTALAQAADTTGADAVVVGAHTPGRGRPPTVGSTIRDLLRDLRCPLVVVPDGVHVSPDQNGPVIVGIGYGEATDAAVRWATRLADERDVSIGLVRSTGDVPIFEPDGLLNLLGYYLEPGLRQKWSQQDLADLARQIQEATQRDVPIAVSTPPGRPAARLVDASEVASLLVIGQHWPMISATRATTRPLRHALTHARCPVAIIPDGSRSGRSAQP